MSRNIGVWDRGVYLVFSLCYLTKVSLLCHSTILFFKIYLKVKCVRARQYLDFDVILGLRMREIRDLKNGVL